MVFVCFLGISTKELVVSGGLRADQLARTLVPSLLEKADRLRRGHTQRTSMSGEHLCPEGLQDRLRDNTGHLKSGDQNNHKFKSISETYMDFVFI